MLIILTLQSSEKQSEPWSPLDLEGRTHNFQTFSKKIQDQTSLNLTLVDEPLFLSVYDQESPILALKNLINPRPKCCLEEKW